MQTLRYAFIWTIVALASVVFGVMLLDYGADLAQAGSFVRLAGLLLAIYGVILAWWRVEAATPVLQAQYARIARRVRTQAFR